MGSSDTGHIHTSNLARKSTVPVHRLVIQRTNRLESTRELALRAGFPEFAVAPHTVAWGYLPKRGKLVKSSFSFRFETRICGAHGRGIGLLCRTSEDPKVSCSRAASEGEGSEQCERVSVEVIQQGQGLLKGVDRKCILLEP